MHTLKTSENFEKNGFTITRLGVSNEASMNNWVLLCAADGECADAEENVCSTKESAENCACEKKHVHFWVKQGHTFMVGSEGCMVSRSDRESTDFEPSDANLAGSGDC